MIQFLKHLSSESCASDLFDTQQECSEFKSRVWSQLQRCLGLLSWLFPDCAMDDVKRLLDEAQQSYEMKSTSEKDLHKPFMMLATVLEAGDDPLHLVWVTCLHLCRYILESYIFLIELLCFLSLNVHL